MSYLVVLIFLINFISRAVLVFPAKLNVEFLCILSSHTYLSTLDIGVRLAAIVLNKVQSLQ